MATVHLLIKGKVQGVFYRATAKDKAGQLNVTGWIKNTPEGDVEAIASGTEENIKTFIAWCRQGPLNAVVNSVGVIPLEEIFFESFQITR